MGVGKETGTRRGVGEGPEVSKAALGEKGGSAAPEGMGEAGKGAEVRRVGSGRD